MASYLVVANRTLAGQFLADHLRGLMAADPGASFTVVVPIAMPVPMEAGGAMVGIGILDPASDPEMQRYLQDAAQERLGRLLAWLRAEGASAEGKIVLGDPLAAAEDAIRTRGVDRIIISTLPPGLSRWLRMDLVHRAERRFSVPITTIVGSTADDADAFDPRPEQHPSAPTAEATTQGARTMSESVYKIIELVGTSTESWEKAATAAVTRASQTLRDLRVAEVVQLDIVIDDNAVTLFRAKLKVSFKYEGED